MDFDEADYARKLERWAVSHLPMFRIEDWQGTWGGAVSGGLFRSNSKGYRSMPSGTMTKTVWHHRPDSPIEIRVISSRPDVDEDGRRHAALTNMAIRIVKAQLPDDATAEERNREVFQLADRLRAGEYPWTTRIVVVEGAAIEFDVLAVGDVWAAFGALDEDVAIDMQGHDIPFGHFRLVELIESEPSVFAETTRWSDRAEDYLMRHRWVPTFMIGWPTWFGNRKASGLRGLPGDLAYLRDSLLKRGDYGN